MQLSIPAQWNDLPQISVRTAPLLDGLEQCAIAEAGRDRISLLLPRDGLVALIAAPEDPNTDGLMLALGQVIAGHVRASSSRLHSAEIIAGPPSDGTHRRIEFSGLEKIEGRISAVGNDIRQCWICADGQAALMFLIRDDVMPLVWVNFSTLEPRDGLLIAVARTLVAHHLACVEGGTFDERRGDG
ncbi:MAG: hypothetical protein HY735_06610 [Verrucomicrobia bacterium]|nr:hypothetical protein [Verrucomicrobiota bacterium]